MRCTARAFGLDPDETLRELLDHPFAIVRLAAYWNRVEPTPGRYCFDELDRQLDAVERAGKQAGLRAPAPAAPPPRRVPRRDRLS